VGAEDLILDDDLAMLFEIALIYSDLDLDDSMVIVNKAILDVGNPEYIRTGKMLFPKKEKEDQKVIDKFSEAICSLHLDLHHQLKDKGVCYIDDTNVVFTFENLRPIVGMPNEYSGVVVLNRIKTQEDLDKIIPNRYRNKKWVFLGKYNRCQGSYFTTTELLDLVSDRKIITFDRYE
jgi:hypothetical protein